MGYKRKPTWAADLDKKLGPAKKFHSVSKSVVTMTITEEGDALFLNSDINDVFLEMGTVVTRRASHVEPDDNFFRIAFHLLRTFGDKNRIAEWTRHWPCAWRINTKPVGGPILTWKDVAPSKCASWMDKLVFTTYDRQEAIDAEVKFLNQFFLERGIQ